MKRTITKQSCVLYHTVYCDLLNMPACTECFARDGGAAEQLKADLDVLISLLPEGGVSHLFTDEKCQFCKGERGGREYYALLDMGHMEPVRKKRSVIGVTVKTSVGSILPLQIGACARCCKRARTLERLPLIVSIAVSATALILLSIRDISEQLGRIHAVMPFFVFAVMTLLGVALGRILARVLFKKYAQWMHMDPFELPTVMEMRQNGWFPLQANNKGVKLIFSKNRMRMGVGTGTEEEALAE